MDKPLVTVICLCYNHEKHVGQAIQSVLHQKYEPIELIVVDDSSSDNSKVIIEGLARRHGFRTHFNASNLGNCKSFNIGFGISSGKYVIDLAADDQLLPSRAQVGAEILEARGETYGVHFCDVELIGKNGKNFGTHFKRNIHGNLLESVPTGNIYECLVEKYLISAPSMMMRRSVLEELGGYDETLSYEDFDFWIRSSRKYRYIFSDHILVKKYVLSKSLSSTQYKKKNRHALSTALVCEKAVLLNRTDQEDKALLKRINYELKWALITENWEASLKFLELKEKISGKNWRSLIEKSIAKIKPPWYPLWKMIFRP